MKNKNSLQPNYPNIALVGNPNCGKTTLFNLLTGSNQSVGNWPGVTVAKKTGIINHEELNLVDLPGVYSLSPYTLEEVITRNYLLFSKPDLVLNLIDSSNIERNLYLTMQLAELGIPMLIALNMMDIVKKRGDQIDTTVIEKYFNCPVVELSALKEKGIDELVARIKKTLEKKPVVNRPLYSTTIEESLIKIQETILNYQKWHENEGDLKKEDHFVDSHLEDNVEPNMHHLVWHHFDEHNSSHSKWFLLKIFEKDQKIYQPLEIDTISRSRIEDIITKTEVHYKDSSDSIIPAERYRLVDKLVNECANLKSRNRKSFSQKIDDILTHRIFAFPIFILMIILVFFVAILGVGKLTGDFVNGGLFGEGWLPSDSGEEFESDLARYEENQWKITEYFKQATIDGYDTSNLVKMWQNGSNYEEIKQKFDHMLLNKTYQIKDRNNQKISISADDCLTLIKEIAPIMSEYDGYLPSIPIIVTNYLKKIECADWLISLTVDGIFAGVGGVLAFVPQLIVLFLLLGVLEGCGYMSRMAFVLDRLFQRFGLSGKSFIPILLGTGCGVTGIMAARTIENDQDQKLTIMTTTFIPCSAKLPMIAMFAGALFGSWWLAPIAYFIGTVAILFSSMIVKKWVFKKNDETPFLMELPDYRIPAFKNLFRSTTERIWSFVKKAGSIILLASVVVWVLVNVGYDNGIKFVDMENSFLSYIGNSLKWLFAPLGWGSYSAVSATITGIIAKENIVGTLKIVLAGEAISTIFTSLSGFSFVIFNLLCIPCVAAIATIYREMPSKKWFLFALLFQTTLAYSSSLVIYQFGLFLTTRKLTVGFIFGIIVLTTWIIILIKRKEAKNA